MENKSKNNVKNILETYRQKWLELKQNPEYQFGIAREYVAEILSLPPDKRFALLSLLKEVEQDSFDRGFDISNLNTISLELEKQKWETAGEKSIPKISSQKITQDDFNKTLFGVFSMYDQFFARIKGYFVFHLENEDNAKTNIIFLYDEEFHRHPLIDLIQKKDNNYEVIKYSIKDFLHMLENDQNVRDQNYLCIILITSNLRNGQIVSPDIKKIIQSFRHNDFISIRRLPVTTVNDYQTENAQEGLDTINNYCNKVLNNRALTFEEETIIKKFFGGNEVVLDYKFLKSGNSGSKVIEVQPSRANYPQKSRFVVKIVARTSENKIRKEKDKFIEFIDDLTISDYRFQYVETASHEAIRYAYASSDSKGDSYPFAELIDASIKGDKNYPFELKTVIDELFNCAPYKAWATITPAFKQVKSLYHEYLNSEDKVLNNIATIKGIEQAILNNDSLVINYQNIKEYSLQTNEKICHGDLHSENFFKDEKGVYLIDFGWTSQHHALIDHATLEASLKFKHLPFYIPMEELIQYENKLLTAESFKPNYDLSLIKRKVVRDIMSLIVQIRSKSLELSFNKNSQLEYLIALFMITFRQIQYGDLNQIYALKSAEILGESIINSILKEKD